MNSLLAWQSIVTDYRETKIVLDNFMVRNAETALAQAPAAVQRMICETYKRVLAPTSFCYHPPGKAPYERHYRCPRRRVLTHCL